MFTQSLWKVAKISNFWRFWADSVRPDSVPTGQSKTIQSETIQSQDNSVRDDSVPGQLSPRQFSPETFQSQDNSVRDDSVPGQLSPRRFSPEWPDFSTFLANSVGLYTIQNYKDCKQYKIIKIVNNTKLYELFISPGNLQDGLHQVYE